MNCPKCQSTEIDSGGFCLVCGLRTVPAEEPRPADEADPSAAISRDGEELLAAAGSAMPADLPEWRQELSRRLQEIKLRREVNGPAATAELAEAASALAAASPPADVEVKSEPAKTAAPRRPRRAPRAPDHDRPAAVEPVPVEGPTAQEAAGPIEDQAQRPEADSSSFTGADSVVRTSAQEVEARRQQYTQDLIDSVVARLSTREKHPGPQEPRLELEPVPKPAPESMPTPEMTPEPVPAPKRESRMEPPALEWKSAAKSEPVPADIPAPIFGAQMKSKSASASNYKAKISYVLRQEPPDDRLILLSRTLAGLVDLIIVVLCAGLIIISVDVLEGIEVFDTISQIHYAALFVILYFVYSVFFLGMAGQTIGMMLTDLKLVARSPRRAPISRILVRCLVFLPCFALMGIGLLWGFFDKRSQCLHDLLSRTRVVRVGPE